MNASARLDELIDRLHDLHKQQAEWVQLLQCTHELYVTLLEMLSTNAAQQVVSTAPRIAVIPPTTNPSAQQPTAPPQPTISPAATQSLKTSPLLQEINERIGIHEPSLNERLKPSATELADKLSHLPVADLRKAIGINDRFLFITELFHNDYQSYEQAIEALNVCKSWEEAWQWISKHLLPRYAWDANDTTVQTFYAVVKKRFSSK
ncbi:MAG: hypothetical protein K6T34_11085 [Thermoflavifilum sp.]|nr:hypothetical protein [Thermoflavifilum sp.]